MTKAQHKEMMQEMKTSVTGYVDELIKDEEFASFKDVEYNKDFSKFTVTVDKEAFENSFNRIRNNGSRDVWDVLSGV